MSNTNPVQTGFADINGTTLYYEVAGAGHPFVLVHGHLLDRRSWDDQFAVFAERYRVIRHDQRGFGDSGQITQGESYSDRQDLYALMKFLGIESAYVMGVSGGGALALDFTLEHPEMVDALIPVTAGVSGFRPSEEVMKKHPDVVRMYTSLNEAFEKHDIARAVEISLELWTDGPGRLPGQAASEVRERVREMTTRNWERPDDEAQAQTPPVPLEPPAVGRLSKIGVPTLVILGELDGPNPLDQLAAEIPGAKYEVVTGANYYRYSVLLTLYLPLLGVLYFGRLIGYWLALLACMDFIIHEAVNNSDWLSNPAKIQSDILFVLTLMFTLALVHVLVREKIRVHISPQHSQVTHPSSSDSKLRKDSTEGTK